jgi:hypothetical protein
VSGQFHAVPPLSPRKAPPVPMGQEAEGAHCFEDSVSNISRSESYISSVGRDVRRNAFVVKLACMEFRERPFSCSRVLPDGHARGSQDTEHFCIHLFVVNRTDRGKVRLVSVTYSGSIRA